MEFIPYVITARDTQALAAATPQYHSTDIEYFNARQSANERFVNAALRLYQAVNGPFGMEMPPWVHYDCVLMSGATFGLAARAAQLPQELMRGLNLPLDEPDMLVPISVAMATPFPDRQTWLIYAVGSMARVAPGRIPVGLRPQSLALGAKVFKIKTMVFTTSWEADTIEPFLCFGPLRVMTAWTPAHDYISSATFRLPIHDAALATVENYSCVELPESNHTLTIAEDALQEMQREIEAGAVIHVVSRRFRDGADAKLEILRGEPTAKAQSHFPTSAPTPLPFKTRNDRIIKELDTFVVGLPENLPFLDDAPFGQAIRWHIDPTLTSSERFLNLLKRLDGLSFGPEGMPMDKWVFYNTAELPGFIFGFAIQASELTEQERNLFQLTDDAEDGPVPISMYIAIPMLEEGAWLGHNLASLNPLLPMRRLTSLATLTKSLGIRAFKVKESYGVTQWESRALNVHCRFGPLNLLTAYTPCHTYSKSLTYHLSVTEIALRAALGDETAEGQLIRPIPQLHLPETDVDGMLILQEKLEAGEGFTIVNRPQRLGKTAVLSLAKRP